jgi:hypothetical protein
MRVHLHSLCTLGRHTEFGNLQALSDLPKLGPVRIGLLSLKYRFGFFGGALGCASSAQPKFDGSLILLLLHAAL